MKQLLLALLALMIGVACPAWAQDATSFLLTRANNLRAAQGLAAYAIHPALTAAAADHARWMAANNRVSHFQSDGTGVRARAPKAGFPSSWVGENIYLGSGVGPDAAWNWWLNSPAHYAGLVSPNYDMIGIGSATAGGRTAFVLVFGNSQGRLSQASGSGASSGGSGGSGGSEAPANPQRSYALGRDEYGNIKHEVQPGHTIGDIALIYGYTWDDIPAMLELNGMTWDDIRYLQPGQVFLVPPKDGAFTPTSAAPSATATATKLAPVTDTPTASQPPARPTLAATLSLRVEDHGTPAAPVNSRRGANTVSYIQLLLLGMAILVQAGVLGGAALALLRR